MILACQNISKSFGTDEIIKHVSFHVEEHEKVAIVGINGAGKSTLLKIIIGELGADEGEVTVAKNKSIGYLAQYQDITGEQTIYEEALGACKELLAMEKKLREMEAEMEHQTAEGMEAFLERYNRLHHEFELKGGYTFRSEITGVLKGLGFAEEELQKHMEELSGGQKTRVALGKLLVTKPDIILLDEPTNHLDMESIAWLENYLKSYKGAVIIVAHDRYFLDRVVTKVVEISRHTGTVYDGNYTAYAKKKEQLREAQLKQYYNQQREIKHQEEVIAKLKSFNREKSIKRAESREKMLDKVERIEKPVDENTDIHISLEPDITSGNDVLEIKDLKKSYEELLFEQIGFEIKRGERVALIGNNGTGKTTILKIINGLVDADDGTVKLGANVHIGYYDQEHQNLHPEKTLFEEISDAYPNLTQTRIRNILAAFLFTDDDVFKRIGDISGGERGRVSLAKLMLSNANFLILDEPTNHLDITSKEILESALNRYTGTVLYVSHDRYFINRTATRILELTGKTVVNYIGNYDYYLEKRDVMNEVYVESRGKKAAHVQEETDVVKAASSDEKLNWEEMKRRQAFARKIENAIKRVENAIAAEEEKKSFLEEECQKPENAVNSAKLNELHTALMETEEKLSALYGEWEDLSLQQEEQ